MFLNYHIKLCILREYASRRNESWEAVNNVCFIPSINFPLPVYYRMKLFWSQISFYEVDFMLVASTDNFVSMDTRSFWDLTFDRLLGFNWYLTIKIVLMPFVTIGGDIMVAYVSHVIISCSKKLSCIVFLRGGNMFVWRGRNRVAEFCVCELFISLWKPIGMEHRTWKMCSVLQSAGLV